MSEFSFTEPPRISRWMAWRRRSVILAAIAAVIVALWLAYPPLYDYRERHQTYHRSHEQKPSESFGAVIRAVGDAIEGHHDLLLVLETLALVAFTGTLSWSTRRLWKSSQINAAHMARSVDLAEASLRHIERPYVFLELVSANCIEKKTSPIMMMMMQDSIRFEYKIINHGRTPAIVYQKYFSVDYIRYCKRNPALPATPPSKPVYAWPAGYMMEVLSSGRETIPKSYQVPKPEDIDVGPFKDRAVIFGYLRYKDIAGRHYECGFGFTWIGAAEFRPFNDNYNYDREIPPPHEPGASDTPSAGLPPPIRRLRT